MVKRRVLPWEGSLGWRLFRRFVGGRLIAALRRCAAASLEDPLHSLLKFLERDLTVRVGVNGGEILAHPLGNLVSGEFSIAVRVAVSEDGGRIELPAAQSAAAPAATFALCLRRLGLLADRHGPGDPFVDPGRIEIDTAIR